MNDMNMLRKRYCPGECSYSSYYLQQAGKGFSDINVYRGVPYQRGLGFGSFFKKIAIPKAKYLGKHLLRTGVTVGADILANQKPKEAVKRRFKETVQDIAEEGLEKLKQSGSGYKRRRRSTVKSKYKKGIVKKRKPRIKNKSVKKYAKRTKSDALGLI